MPLSAALARFGLRLLLRLRGRAVFSRLNGKCSRASMAVESREIWPISLPPWVALMIASCIRWGNCVCANSAKAREKVASCGNWSMERQPHRRRICASTLSKSSSWRVVAQL